VKLIVGLGNPSAKYDGTRHNVGFEVVDELVRRLGLVFESSPTKAVMARARGSRGDLILAKPLTFMNLSGQAVGELSKYYHISVEDLLMVSDDINLSLGQLRARSGGSDGGHNGLRSVIELLGTEQVPRLRVGIGRGELQRDLSDHVLDHFKNTELQTIKTTIIKAADAAELFVDQGIEAVMNRFNRADLTGDLLEDESERADQ